MFYEKLRNKKQIDSQINDLQLKLNSLSSGTSDSQNHCWKLCSLQIRISDPFRTLYKHTLSL